MRQFILLTSLLLSSCMVGPNYVRPAVQIPETFKEAPEGWKMAQPQDACPRGAWWTVFNEPDLSDLEYKLNISNQNILASIAQYDQAKALVLQATAAFFPTLGGSGSVTRQKQALSSLTTGDATSPTTDTTVANNNSVFDLYNVTLDATWVPDLWGAIRRNVASTVATAKADAAQVALTKLLAEASLAQYYFQIRGLDTDQILLDDTVNNYEKILKITLNQYKAGTASRLNVVQAQSVLEVAKASAIDNGVNRAVYEHAIAVLIGVPPSLFTYAPNPLVHKEVFIPVDVPSQWLERRPDVAQAERAMAAANELIGVAVAAYFPVLTLTGTFGYQAEHLYRLFRDPSQFWSLGAQLADVIFDAGLRSAQIDQARGVYNQAVATYKQTVLTAFQDVEDNLATLRILEKEEKVLNEAVVSAQWALKIALNEYKAGTIQLLDVLNAEVTAYTAQKNANDVLVRKLVSAALLAKALGGGWDINQLPTYGCCTCEQNKTCPEKGDKSCQ